MVNYEDLVSNIKQLSLKERLSLLEEITRSVREDLDKPARNIAHGSQIRGMVKPKIPLPDSTELKENYIDYLIEKYR